MKKTGILLLLSFLIIPTASTLHSQAKSAGESPQFDHFALYVHDLTKSATFYEKVMELKQIPEPFKDGRHAWFRMGSHDQLHVVSSPQNNVLPDSDIHLAFRVPSLSAFMARLDQMHVKYGDSYGHSYDPAKSNGKVKDRPDGIKQIYLQDPDGYWIEVNDDKF